MSTKKRGQNEDSIYKDGDRWRGAVSLGYGPDGKRTPKKVSGKTRAEVVEKVRKLKETLAKGAPVPDDRLTVAAFLDRWLLHLPGHISDGTLDDYEDNEWRQERPIEGGGSLHGARRGRSPYGRPRPPGPRLRPTSWRGARAHVERLRSGRTHASSHPLRQAPQEP
ncbi:hypothetical protein GCM10009733_019140 [Nonomuraea maheshkhaliensis]|uniref:Integrase SAM-like N-terminal domain-containing protein n=1 Tax=Nonomuraea maheshkhaliensis TaxID=419590 RepID=A0ABN2EYP2_9ACTN